MPEPNGWNEYSRLVLSELKRLDESHIELVKKVDVLITDVAVLKIKYGLIGGFIGAVPGVVALILRFVE